MRRFSVLFALVACLASVALAQSDRRVAQFEALGVQPITGQARLNPIADGTRIQVVLKGLDPDAQYVSLMFLDNSTCTTGGVSSELSTFTANHGGNAVFNVNVTQDISAIRSIDVQLASDPAVLACAAVQ